MSADYASFELYELSHPEPLCVVGVSGPRAQAEREIQHYAAMYGQDGPVEIRELPVEDEQ